MVPKPASYPGAGFFLTIFLGLMALGCQGVSADPEALSAEEARALGLPEGTRLHRITLGGRGAQEHAVPTLTQASPGDAVEFRTADHRVHTLSFLEDSLSVGIRDFLRSTGQMASPPLVSRGTRFILSLQNAPLGRYPYISEGHGGEARGVIEVAWPSETDSSDAGSG